MSRAEPRGFASDNHSGAHPEVLAAVAAANEGHAGSYGADGWTARAGELLREHFGPRAAAFPVFNGTAANVLAIDALRRPHEAVVCAAGAHIDVDECGAVGRHTGSRLLTVATAHGKLAPADLERWEERRGDPHHSQPRLVSVAQASEAGTVYQPGELRALAEAAEAMGMLLHVDGARLANAAAALGCSLAEAAGAGTRARSSRPGGQKMLVSGAGSPSAGAAAISLGVTKNGGLFGDVVVFPDPDPRLVRDFPFVRKQGMQLASKMRFLSAQIEALFGPGELWRRNAARANAAAARLAAGVEGIAGVELVHPAEANGVFARLPRPAIDRLLTTLPGPHPFYVWDEGEDIVRWLCSWDTTDEDVDGLLAGLRSALG